jgi:hypothetical protein
MHLSKLSELRSCIDLAEVKRESPAVCRALDLIAEVLVELAKDSHPAVPVVHPDTLAAVARRVTTLEQRKP